MPTYEFVCDSCDHYFTKFLGFDRMLEPETEPCPECAEESVKKVMLTPPAIGDAVRLRVKRPDGGFRDVLHKIHEKMPGSQIKKNSSYI